MHHASLAIKAIIDSTPGYSLDVLLKDLGGASATHDRLLSIKEAAEYLNVSVGSIFRWVRTGRIKGSAVAGLNRIKESELKAFVCDREEGGVRCRY